MYFCDIESLYFSNVVGLYLLIYSNTQLNGVIAWLVVFESYTNIPLVLIDRKFYLAFFDVCGAL